MGGRSELEAGVPRAPRITPPNIRVPFIQPVSAEICSVQLPLRERPLLTMTGLYWALGERVWLMGRCGIRRSWVKSWLCYRVVLCVCGQGTVSL